MREAKAARRVFESELVPAAAPCYSSATAMDREEKMPGAPLPRAPQTAGDRALIAAEIALVILWSLFITSPYLNRDPRVIPSGRELLCNIQTFHAWSWMRECGACAFWFGGVNGGFPTAAEVNGSTFHPMVVASTLLLGPLAGAKIILAASFLLAGLAQWWLARILGAGRIARVWSACIAVAAGSLSSDMALGALSMVVSAATAALLFPLLVLVSREGRRRHVVFLAVAAASLLLAGNGYLQVGFALMAPLTLLLIRPENLSRIWSYALAAALALLLAAPVLVPFLHFLPNFNKSIEPGFAAQPFFAVPLNLVIDDSAFYRSTVLGKLPYAFGYALYIGWIPVLLAFWGLGDDGRREERRTILFLAATAVFALWLGSAGPLRLLMKAIPVRAFVLFLEGLRYPGYMAGLAIPPILGLAGLGLDRLLRARWPALQFGVGGRPGLSLSLRWLLAIPLVLALVSARKLGTEWIRADPQLPEVSPVLSALRTPDSQWVSVPYGELFWIQEALERGMKLTNHSYYTWRWDERRPPDPVLVASRQEAPGMIRQSAVGDIGIYRAPPGAEYAAVISDGGRRSVCTARARGGNIDVTCDNPEPGTLVVKENAWTGWRARSPRGTLPLLPGQWLGVRVPTGHNVIQFRYRPWDVLVGWLLCLGALAFCAAYLVGGRVPLLPRIRAATSRRSRDLESRI